MNIELPYYVITGLLALPVLEPDTRGELSITGELLAIPVLELELPTGAVQTTHEPELHAVNEQIYEANLTAE